MQEQRMTRVLDGVQAVKSGSQVDASEIVQRFKEAKSTTPDRRKTYVDRAEKVLREDSVSTEGEQSAQASSSSPSTTVAPESRASDEDDAYERDLAEATKQSLTSGTPRGRKPSEGEYERELEMAKQISLAEQRGYERGLAHHSGGG
jgi:phage/plasmid primase-like uncharacterized protein